MIGLRDVDFLFQNDDFLLKNDDFYVKIDEGSLLDTPQAYDTYANYFVKIRPRLPAEGRAG